MDKLSKSKLYLDYYNSLYALFVGFTMLLHYYNPMSEASSVLLAIALSPTNILSGGSPVSITIHQGLRDIPYMIRLWSTQFIIIGFIGVLCKVTGPTLEIPLYVNNYLSILPILILTAAFIQGVDSLGLHYTNIYVRYLISVISMYVLVDFQFPTIYDAIFLASHTGDAVLLILAAFINLIVFLCLHSIIMCMNKL